MTVRTDPISSMPTRAVPCAVCDGDAHTTLCTNDRYDMALTTVGCNACGLLFTNPQPTAEAMVRFYELDYRRYYENTEQPSADYIRRLKKDVRADHMVQYLLRELNLHVTPRVLDVGCAEGAVLKRLTETVPGASLFGIEPNPDFAGFASQYTGAEIAASLDDVVGQQFDLIVTNHVLEHINDPLSYLRTLRALLTDTGSLYVAVPDAESYRNLADLHIAHLYHFTRQTLQDLLSKAGLTPIHMERHEPQRHPISIRCIVNRSAESLASTNITAEPDAWSVMAKIEAHAWRYRLRRHPLVRLLVSPLTLLRQSHVEPSR